MGRWYASKRAADVSGASIETVRRWAVHYYLSLVHVEPSAIDNAKENACRKGVPNLTVEMFRGEPSKRCIF